MAPQEFTRLMRLAHDMGHYGAGYERGLRRFFLRDVTDPERHRAFMALATSAKPAHAAMGHGYRDGLAGRLPTPGEWVDEVQAPSGAGLCSPWPCWRS